MATVVRFTFNSTTEIFVAGVGLVKNGVFDVPVSDTAAVATVRTRLAPYGATEEIVDSSIPSTPPVRFDDPYPQYSTMQEVAEWVASDMTPVALALRAAFVHVSETGELVLTIDGEEIVVGSGGAGGLTAEQVQDLVDAMIVEGPNVTKTYDDAAGTLTISAAGGGGGGVDLSQIVATSSVAYAATITPAVSGRLLNVVNVGALTGAVTIANPTGTKADGMKLELRLEQDATGERAIAWGTDFAFGSDLTAAMLPDAPSSKYVVLFGWDAGSSKWRALGLSRGF